MLWVLSMFLMYDFGLMVIFVMFGSKFSICIIDLKIEVMLWKFIIKESMFQFGEILMGDFLEEINIKINEDLWQFKIFIY